MKHLKVFAGTFLAIFMVVSLQLSGIKPPKLALPTPRKADIFIDSILLKLEKNRNDYKLIKKQPFIQAAGAVEDYENAAAYIVADYGSGEVLASKNSDKRLSIASLTKIMSAVVALDLADEQELMEYTENASAVYPTKIGGIVGEQLSVSEVLHASLMTSANDAAQMLEDGINSKYKGDYFVDAMNEKARILGLKNTSFANPQGFDNQNNYSSVEDLAVLTRYVFKNYPLITEIAKLVYVLLRDLCLCSPQHLPFK